MSTLQKGCVKSFPDNNIVNSILRNPVSISIKMINGYDNLDRTEIPHGKVCRLVNRLEPIITKTRH